MGQPHELKTYEFLDALASTPVEGAEGVCDAPVSDSKKRRQTYLDYYGFREKPFDLLPNPDFLYLPRRHKEILASILFGLEENKGFLKIIADPGMGKTTVCRSLLRGLKSHYRFAYISHPVMDDVEMLQSISMQFGLPSDITSKKALILNLHRFLVKEHKEGRKAAVLIDEAQNLDAALWEEVRLLSNMETETEKLIQFVLLGQPALDKTLAKAQWKSLKQRIAVHARWRPFSRDEMRGYLVYRLNRAGGQGKVLFDTSAINWLYRYSRGYPRMINAVADRALCIAHRLETRKVTAPIIRQAADDLGGLTLKPSSLKRFINALWKWFLFGMLLLLALGFATNWNVSFKTSWEVDLDKLVQNNLFNNSKPGTLVVPKPKTSSLQPGISQPVRSASGAFRIIHSGQLQGYFQTLTQEESHRHATEWLLKRWKTPELFRNRFGSAGWDVIEKELGLIPVTLNANLERLQSLNYPAMLDIQIPNGVGTRHLVLLGIRKHTAIFGSKDLLEIPLDLIYPLWDRKPKLFWKNFERLPKALEVGQRGDEVVWLQRSLRALGYFDGLEAPLYGPQTVYAVKKYQTAHRLDITGKLDRTTQMLLYNQAKKYPTPHLITE